MYYETINNYLPLVKEESIDSNLIKLARMNEAVIATEDSPIIGTGSLATCIGLLLKDENNAMLFHLSDNFDLVLEVVNDFESDITPIIIPGFYTRTEKIEELKSVLKQCKKFKEAEVMNASGFITEEFECIDIAYDTRTNKFIKPNIKELVESEGREPNGRN